jgi:hypothetical protein
MRVSGDQRKSERFVGELELIGRRAKLNGAAKGAADLPQVRITNMRASNSDRSDVAACDLSKNLESQRELKLCDLPRAVPRNPDKANLDDDAFRLSQNFQARAFVDNAAVPRKERPRLAEIFRGGHDVEQQPSLARVCLLSEVQPEGAIVHRLRRVFEKFDLTDRGYAMARIVERVFGKTGAMQQWLGGYVAFVESRYRALGGEPCHCRRLLGRALGHVNAPNQGFAQVNRCSLLESKTSEEKVTNPRLELETRATSPQEEADVCMIAPAKEVLSLQCESDLNNDPSVRMIGKLNQRLSSASPRGSASKAQADRVD